VIADLKPVVPMGADPGPVLAAPVAEAAPTPTPRTPPKQPPLELTP